MYQTGQPRRAPDMPFDYSGVDPSRMGGGLLSAARRALGGGGGMGGGMGGAMSGGMGDMNSGGGIGPMQTPPIVPPQSQPMGGMDMSGGQNQFMQAFSQNPQFQQQLMAMMQGQSPGFRPPQFTPMPAALPVPGAQGR